MSRPVPFTGCNLRLVAPEGRDDVEPLDAFTNGNCIVTCWELSPEEMQSVQRTGRVWLTTMGNRFAPAFVGDEKAVRDVVSGYGRTIPQQPKEGE